MLKIAVVMPAMFAAMSVWTVAQADVLLRYTPDGKPASATTTDNLDLYVGATNILMTGRGPGGKTYSVWYDSAKDAFILLDEQRKGYFELKESMFNGLKEQQARLREDLNNQLQTLPPEKHAKAIEFVEQLERKEYGGPPVEPIRFEATKTGETVLGHNCNNVDVFVGDVKAREVCIASYKTLKISPSDQTSLAQMHDTALALSQSVRRVADMLPRFGVDLVDGIPLSVRYLAPAGTSGKPLILSEISKQKFDEKRFALPPGYKPVSLPGWAF
jgi:hypothetical protein